MEALLQAVLNNTAVRNKNAAIILAVQDADQFTPWGTDISEF